MITAHEFLMNCPDEVVTRARIAIRMIAAGNWREAGNQYAMASSELQAGSDMRSAANELHDLCRKNETVFKS